MIKKIQISLLLLLFTLFAGAQYYDTGQDPASLNWRKLDSYHFSFIYPESYSPQINKLVYSFEKAYDLLKGSYKEPILDRIPVIIHNYSTESNGYVVWAPGRIELFPYPGQNGIPMDHIEQLALHEMMHVLQMYSFKRGVSKILTYPFGEQYTGALAAFTPSWFLEGDAIFAESAWSYSGRAKVPAFEKRLKALLLEKNEIYRYDKMLFGSYRDYTPDHYQFGYQMSAWARSKFGDKVWQEPMDYVALRPYTINPFNAALKKYTDHTKEDIYYETMVFLKNKWKEEEDEGSVDKYTPLNPAKDDEYINYYSPVPAGRDSVIAVKTSLYHVPVFVLIDTNTGMETKLFTPGSVWPYKISFGANTIAWAEHYNDPRWQNRDYSVIKTYNIKTGTSATISSKSRYFGPDISPDGSRIVVSESTADYTNSLVILDARTGDVKARYRSPANRFISYPSWSDDMEEIIFISTNTDGEGIMSLVPGTGEWKSYIEEDRNDLQSVRKSGSSVYFVSSLSGTDNAYRIDEEGNVYRITSSRFGIRDISIMNESVFFADYSAGGHNLVSSNINDTEQIKDEPGRDHKRLIDGLDKEEKFVFPEDYDLPSNYREERYSKVKGLFRFHSWMPFYADVNDISFDRLPVSPGATLMSQNNLSTLISTLGYEYKSGEHIFHSNISWKGWYPAVDFSLDYGGDPVIYNSNDTTAIPSVIYSRVSANTTIYLPLSFRRSRFVQTLWPSINLRYSNRYVLDEDEESFDYGQSLINARLYFSNLHRMSHRDIWPRFGQVLDLYYTASLFDSDLYGPVSTLRTAFYFPGVFKNDAIRLRYQYEKQDFRRLLLHNRISFPRGYKKLISEELNSFSFDYAFPLAYPDFQLGQFIYLNRIRNTVFFDYAISNNLYDIEEQEKRDGKDYFSSAGTELLADFYLLRIPVRFSAGVQAAWLPFERSPHFEFLLNMDIFGFVLNRERPY